MKLFYSTILFILCSNTIFAQSSKELQSNETFAKEYHGVIGKYPITVKLINRFGDICGQYVYDNYKGNPDNIIELDGMKESNSINLYYHNEIGELLETFNGKYMNDSTIIGTWYRKDKKNKLPFTIIEKKDSIKYPKNTQLNNLKVYANLDPWNSKFFEQKNIQTELKKILSSEYNSYLDFLTGAGYAPFFIIEDNMLIEDFSYSHIGCSNQSILAIDLNTHCFYLCWIKEKSDTATIYYDNSKPMQDKIMKYFITRLKTGWQHSYLFSVSGDKILIKRKNNH
ncbi:MAG: hypothetical protein WCG87_03345 [Bacteroidota bacterium]